MKTAVPDVLAAHLKRTYLAPATLHIYTPTAVISLFAVDCAIVLIFTRLLPPVIVMKLVLSSDTWTCIVATKVPVNWMPIVETPAQSSVVDTCAAAVNDQLVLRSSERTTGNDAVCALRPTIGNGLYAIVIITL